jgi:hypothetical protein
MRTVVLFFVLIQSVLFCREQRPYLRALIVHDTSTPDIQIASTADVNRVKQAFSFIADQTGLSFKPTVVEASKLSKKTLCAWLKTIRHSSKKEVAFFYYAGRGTNIHTSKWPLIRLGKGLHISEPVVAKRIKSRKPKLVERFSKSFTKFMVHLYPRVFYKLDEGDYEVQAIGVAPRRAKKINRAE